MKVVITGGAGFLGQLLIAELLNEDTLSDAQGQPQEIERIVVFDQIQGQLTGQRVSYVTGDIGDTSLLSGVLDATVGGVFHLATVVSGTAEVDFDLGMRVNIRGTEAVLEACRALPKPAKFLFTSSVAVFGGPLPDLVTDETPATPQTSYEEICPVDPDTRLWITSPRQVIASFLHAYKLPAAVWGMQRSLNLPGITVRVGDMVETLGRIAGPSVSKLVRWQPDARIKAIVQSWPTRFDTARANAMGFNRDNSFDLIIQDYIRTCAQ